MTIFQQTDAVSRIEASRNILTRLEWGDGVEAVCMMSAMVPGAKVAEDCVTEGWPMWLVKLNVLLFDVEVGVEDELAAAVSFAYEIAHAVSKPFDTDKALDLFLIARLDTGEHSALKTLRGLDGDWSIQATAVEEVVALLRRRADGEDVDEQLMGEVGDAAAHAAVRAAHGADDSVAYVARAAFDVVDAVLAVDTVHDASGVAAFANHTCHIASNVTNSVAFGADDAVAYASARRDLVDAIKGARGGNH